MAAAGLLGHLFVCPDMIGGGLLGSFKPGVPVDQELFVRSAQVHALSPMMQFSVAPWRVLDKEHLALVKAAVELRQKFAPHILRMSAMTSSIVFKKFFVLRSFMQVFKTSEIVLAERFAIWSTLALFESSCV
jgi:alpha-glucosidase (family GH31 glycosyl hydrolase)